MSLKLQIETAKDAVSKALITALENKNESVVRNLITCYNTISNIVVTEPFNIDLTGGIYTNNYKSNNIPSSMNDDVISFTGLG